MLSLVPDYAVSTEMSDRSYCTTTVQLLLLLQYLPPISSRVATRNLHFPVVLYTQIWVFFGGGGGQNVMKIQKCFASQISFYKIRENIVVTMLIIRRSEVH